MDAHLPLKAHEVTRKRTQTACEACRTTKIRCQPSVQPGVCQKCLESKRECVSRTGPRTRRVRRARKYNSIADNGQGPTPLPPLPKPSGTFTIDFEVAGKEDVDNNFETLRDAHVDFIESLFPPSHETEDPLLDSTCLPVPSPHTSSGHSQSIEDLHAKPTFNISSAESLLKSFQDMLTHFPCTSLPSDITIQELSTTRPFVLLAILASASGSRTLQGHNLYDEEFRKVLGLKYVAGGESTLELLQGILIYCAWYPFHLRPKSKQVFQYLAMASDIIQTLELDKEQQDTVSALNISDHKLECMRAYLAYCYITTASIMMWKSHRGSEVRYTAWTWRCCDILDANDEEPRDAVLACLVRLGNVGFEAATATHEKTLQGEQVSKLVLLGLESQLASQLARMPPQVASCMPVRIQSIFVSFCLDAGDLLRIPRSQQTAATILAPRRAFSLDKIHSTVYSLKSFFQLILSLDEQSFLCFATTDWGKIVFGIVLALRLSFPLPSCPDFDSSWSRSELSLDRFLDKFSMDPGLTATSKKVDILSATRVIVGVVKEKYYRQLELHMHRLSLGGKPAAVAFGCPMMEPNMHELLVSLNHGVTGPVDMSQDLAGMGTGGQAGMQDWWTMMAGWQ